MIFRVILLIFCLAEYSYASWLCPVYRADSSGLVEGESSENLAVLKSWYATIQPLFIENETMPTLTRWDYAVCEDLVLIPPVSGCDILICLDLGAVPELTRELEFFWVNGVLIEPRSMLAGYPIDINNPDEATESYNPPADSVFHIHRCRRGNGIAVSHGLCPEEVYRSRFDSEDDFRSAVPETRRFYADMWEVPCNGEEEITVQVQYIAQGWTYITGSEPLRFSLCQPLLWNGPLGDGRIVFERPWTDDPEMWLVEFDGNELIAEDTHCYEVKVSDFSITVEEYVPFLLVEPDPVILLE